MSKNYFECKYRGPYKGVNTQLPEDLLTPDYTPFMNNFILKNGEIRTRPRQSLYIPGPPDGKPILFITSFMDANNVYHTCIVTATGLWQLNRPWQNKPITSKKTWSLIGAFTQQPGANNPAATQVFVNKLFWTNGGTNLWVWDGITSVGAPALWKKSTAYIKGSVVLDSNGKVQVAGNSGISATAAPVWSVVLAG